MIPNWEQESESVVVSFPNDSGSREDKADGSQIVKPGEPTFLSSFRFLRKGCNSLTLGAFGCNFGLFDR